jgi:glucose-1-phosphate thymidylyltransferase
MDQRFAGIIPAAGMATRLSGLPFSKELYPIGVKQGQVNVASSHLLDSLDRAEIDQLHMVIRDGKWDIPAYFGSKYKDSLPISYHVAEYGYGVPFTVNQAYPFVRGMHVMLGFPDILFYPEDAYAQMKKVLIDQPYPVVLGLFPVSNPSKYDMVVTNEEDVIEQVVIKPAEGDFHYAWITAAWKPEFSDFLNEFIDDALKTKTEAELMHTELHFGHVIIAAIEAGMKVKGLIFASGRSLDIGTPQDLNTYARFLNDA